MTAVDAGGGPWTRATAPCSGPRARQGLRRGRAVDGVDFALEPGALRCIIGPNGAGKSTFFKLLLGSIKPDKGTITFRGRDVTRTEPHRRAHMGIGVKFQHLGVYGDLTVAPQHAAAAAARPLRRGDGCGDRAAARSGSTSPAPRSAGLPSSAHGQRQWLAIGMALAMRPVLLLLDEPTAGMGPEETRATGALVHSVHEEGVTIVVVEHDMAFVRQLGAPVTVLHYGRVFAEGSLAAIEGNEDVRNIYLGASGSMAFAAATTRARPVMHGRATGRDSGPPRMRRARAGAGRRADRRAPRLSAGGGE